MISRDDARRSLRHYLGLGKVLEVRRYGNQAWTVTTDRGVFRISTRRRATLNRALARLDEHRDEGARKRMNGKHRDRIERSLLRLEET